MAEPAELLAQMRLQRLGQEAFAEHVPVPEAAVLDEHPAVDPARGRGELLARRLRHIGAKLSPGANRHRRKATHVRETLQLGERGTGALRGEGGARRGLARGGYPARPDEPLLPLEQLQPLDVLPRELGLDDLAVRKRELHANLEA